MIRVKNEITEKDINGNVNSQLAKPMTIRFLIGFLILAAGVTLICLNVIKWLGIVLTVVGGLFDVLIIVMYFIVRNSAIKQNNFGDKKLEYEYRFDPRFFSVTAYVKGKKQGIMNFNYQDISKYKETKDKFYVYLNNNQTLIIAKNVRYAEGSPEALHRILQERANKTKKKK
ncbi:MAG: YcxB family protein [Clostridiales bacterium]|nr:YcxB family protein [Clostridiales bacterium]